MAVHAAGFVVHHHGSLADAAGQRDLQRDPGCVERASLPFGGKLSNGIKASPATIELARLAGLGFSTTSVERASGQHARHLLAVVEEASGVEDYVFDAIDSLGYERLVCIGNPIRAEGKFVELIRQADRDRADNIPPSLAVNAIRIPSTDSPHAATEKSPFGLADRTWLEAMYRKYGRDSLWVRSHIDARIPDVDSEQLIPIDWLNHHHAQARPTVAPTHPIHRTVAWPPTCPRVSAATRPASWCSTTGAFWTWC